MSKNILLIAINLSPKMNVIKAGNFSFPEEVCRTRNQKIRWQIMVPVTLATQGKVIILLYRITAII